MISPLLKLLAASGEESSILYYYFFLRSLTPPQAAGKRVSEFGEANALAGFNHLLIPFLIGIFLAVNMGGSGTAPSFSAAYGANILRKSVIPGFFGIMVFAGALIAGKATATTVGKELLPAEMMSFSLVSIILFSVGISLFIANLIGIPQSTSQATILAVTGPACYFSVLNERKLLLEIIP